MLRYSKRDATRIDELQQVTKQYRKELMLAIISIKMGGLDCLAPSSLEQLGRGARKAQEEIDDIALLNRRRTAPASWLTRNFTAPPRIDECNQRGGEYSFEDNEPLGHIRADQPLP